MTYPAQNTSPSPGGSPWRLPQLRHRVAVPAVVLLLVATVGNLLVLTPQVTFGETALLEGLTHYRNAPFDAVATAIQYGLSNLMVVVIVAAITAWLAVARKTPLDAAGFAVVALTGWGAIGLVKAAVHRPRPSLESGQALLEVSGASSFPSGHTGAAVAIVLALALVFYRHQVRNRILVIGTLGVLVVALTRIYASAHFPVDVAFALPAAWSGVMFGCSIANKFVPALAFGFGWRQEGVTVPVPARVRQARARRAEAAEAQEAAGATGVVDTAAPPGDRQRVTPSSSGHPAPATNATASAPVTRTVDQAPPRSRTAADHEVAFDQDHVTTHHAA